MKSPSSLLQRERIIQISGLLVMMSPFFNLYFTYRGLNSVTPVNLSVFFSQVKMITWMISATSLLTGAMMLQGRRSSWTPVLLLIGFFIITNILSFKKNAVDGIGQPLAFLLINISLFILVYSQEFHQKTQKAGLELIRRIKRDETMLSPTMNFEGHGPWAKLVAATTTHISMRAISPPPANIDSRLLEVDLSADLILQARFIHQQERNGHQEYIFEWVALDGRRKQLLYDWLLSRRKKIRIHDIQKAA
ncbi:MAG: hypothetical protein AB7O96_17710 [Pseudobdellovibrionaceae bacterium]